MTPDDMEMLTLMLILGIIGFLAWAWIMNRMFDEMEPKPIARERKDLNAKIRI